jgi:hypothetical protein
MNNEYTTKSMAPIWAEVIWVRDNYEFDPDDLKNSVLELVLTLEKLYAKQNNKIFVIGPKLSTLDRKNTRSATIREWIDDLKKVNLLGGKENNEKIIQELKNCTPLL